MPPDFASVEYWNNRFVKETEPFEWLKNPDALIPHLKPIIDKISTREEEEDRKILHLGPGSSRLSIVLRNLAANPEMVHNVDYSHSAIDLGRSLEKESFPDNDNSNNTGRSMNWSCLDIMRLQGVRVLTGDGLFGPQFSMIVDKSSADSIACGPNAVVNARVFRTAHEESLGEDDDEDDDDSSSEERTLHPVVVLALHLAVLCTPGAYWLSLSYSSDRYAVLSQRQDVEDHLQPGLYWTVESVEPMMVEELLERPRNGILPVHRPPITYWLYKLRRTNEILALSSYLP